MNKKQKQTKEYKRCQQNTRKLFHSVEKIILNFYITMLKADTRGRHGGTWLYPSIPRSQEWRQESHKFETTLDYIESFWLSWIK